MPRKTGFGDWRKKRPSGKKGFSKKNRHNGGGSCKKSLLRAARRRKAKATGTPLNVGEAIAARIAEKLLREKRIEWFYPVPPNSFLDRNHIDIVFYCRGKIIVVQIKKSENGARHHRELYPRIPVIVLDKNDFFSEKKEEMFTIIREFPEDIHTVVEQEVALYILDLLRRDKVLKPPNE